jgi:2-polyprenyl-3-methyl-5-hydroxy-6-metoxy-1,4-benzoquinol methylase
MAESAKQPPSGGYDLVHFAKLDAVEDRHFWFRARGRAIDSVVRQIAAPLAPGYRVLELGCGNGTVLRILQNACPTAKVIGMDLFLEGLRFAKNRSNCLLIQGDMRKHPFGETKFDLIGCFDVLEHLRDDVEVLRGIHALLAPGGALFLTVPAHMSLWSSFDEVSGHCRRYSAAELRQKLVGTGFRMEYLSQFMVSILPLMSTSRRLSHLR